MEHHPIHQQYYHFPARLSVEDQLLSIGPFSLTLRQGFVLTIGACLAANLWRWSAALAEWQEPGLLLRICLAALPVLLALGWSVIRPADRYLEDWSVILLRYLSQPRQYRWASMYAPPSMGGDHASQQHATTEEEEVDI